MVCHLPLSVAVQDLGRYGIAPRRITATHEFQVDHQGEADELGRVLGKRQHTGKEREASVLSDLFGDSFLRDIVRPARWGRCEGGQHAVCVGDESVTCVCMTCLVMCMCDMT